MEMHHDIRSWGSRATESVGSMPFCRYMMAMRVSSRPGLPLLFDTEGFSRAKISLMGASVGWWDEAKDSRENCKVPLVRELKGGEKKKKPFLRRQDEHTFAVEFRGGEALKHDVNEAEGGHARSNSRL